MQMTYESMMAFAETWIAAWNRRDVEAVLAHFAEEAQFVSPVARNFVGRPVLRNKKEHEDYWRGALTGPIEGKAVAPQFTGRPHIVKRSAGRAAPCCFRNPNQPAMA